MPCKPFGPFGPKPGLGTSGSLGQGGSLLYPRYNLLPSSPPSPIHTGPQVLTLQEDLSRPEMTQEPPTLGGAVEDEAPEEGAPKLCISF